MRLRPARSAHDHVVRGLIIPVATSLAFDASGHDACTGRAMRAAIVSTSRGTSPGYRKYLVNMLPRLRQSGLLDDVALFTADVSLRASEPELDAHAPGGGRRSLRRAVSEFSPDVVLCPAARALSPRGTPVVMLVQNMEPMLAPFGAHGPLEIARSLARRLAIRRSCAISSHIVVPAEHSRQYLVRRWHIPEAEITVVPFGVEPAPPRSSFTRPEQVPENAPFAFAPVGSVRPARGVGDVVDALAALRERGTPVRMVIAGGETAASNGYERALRERARRTGIDFDVIWTGQLSAPEMAWCYGNCDVFVSATHAEALSMTTLEVLSHGCVVVASDLACTREVFGPNASYFPVGDVGALANAIASASQLDAETRERRRDAMRQHARAFDWTRSAERTAEVLLHIKE